MRKSLFTCKLHVCVQWIVIYPALFFMGITILFPFSCMAQTNSVNSLLQRLTTNKNDTDKVNIYYTISKLYWTKNSDSALMMANKAMKLARKIHFEKGIALSYLVNGVALVSKGKMSEALECYFQCLSISEKLGMEELKGNTYNNIGNVYTFMDDYKKALYFYGKAYKIALKQHDPSGYATVGLLINMGEIFKKKKQPDSAIAYNTRALHLAKRVKDTADFPVALYNIGENYLTKRNYLKAQVFLYEALGIAKKSGDDEDVAYCRTGLALVFYYTGKLDSCMLFAQTGLQESKKLAIVDLTTKAYNVLYLIHQKTGNYKTALYYRNLEVDLNDSLKTIDKQKAIRNIQSAYELEQKQIQIELLNKDKIISQKEIERIKFKWNILTSGVIILILLVFFLFKNYSQKRRLSEHLALQNVNISAQNNKLEQLVLVKDRLFSIIGHDLKGPIRTICQMMDMIKEKDISEDESEYWIEKACENLTITSHLVENLLYWAKSQMEGIQANPYNFDVQRIIAQNINLLKARATEKKVIVKGIKATTSETVYGDEIMIDIVIRNLMENAIKFSKAGDIVTIAAEKKESSTLITVKDSGQGIPEEAIAKIFNKFSSYTTFGTANERGSGLGLLLCKELVEKNNGKLWFESKEGVGSKFYFTVPSL